MSRRVLIIDDEDDIREIAALKFGQREVVHGGRDFRVIVAQHGAIGAQRAPVIAFG